MSQSEFLLLVTTSYLWLKKEKLVPMRGTMKVRELKMWGEGPDRYWLKQVALGMQRQTSGRIAPALP